MWAITIADDADSTGEKTITGIWTDNDGEFSFSLRGTPDEKGQNSFIESAIKARDAWQTKKSDEKTFIANCLAKMNITDTKAVA